MKKTLLITFGILFILLIAGVWVYLFMFGKPAGNAGVFTRFGGSGEEVPMVTPQAPLDIPDTVAPSATRFWKVTARPVAGAGFTETSIRYVEEGTGHIYERDFETFTEQLISGTTVPQATEAQFSLDAEHVAITAKAAQARETVLGKIESGEGVKGVSLPTGAREVAFAEDGMSAYYLLHTATGASGYRYDIEKETSTELFAIPLRDVRVLWGDPIYVYTIPTGTQVGYVYKIEGKSTLAYIAPGASGLVIARYGTGITLTSISQNIQTFTALGSNGTAVDMPIPAIPEKCIADAYSPTFLVCAAPESLAGGTFPDSWYMGALSYEDVLWEVDAASGVGTVLLNFTTESGEPMDVYGIGTNYLGTLIYFINKNDNSLWVFDRTVR